jgi:predicted RNA-binding Zn-ribbon protein involved in translation (DUF1610 family)
MTKNHALTVSITEIKALELRCTKCAGMISLPLGYTVNAFIKCPGCGEALIDNGDCHSAISKLYASLGQWKRFKDLPLNLTFTIDLPFEDK